MYYVPTLASIAIGQIHKMKMYVARVGFLKAEQMLQQISYFLRRIYSRNSYQ